MANLSLKDTMQNALERVKAYVDARDKEQIGELSDLQTTDKTNVVNAINELFQNANNGKGIIADAIGGELSDSDTFAAMGTKIDNMSSTLSTFITDNGGTVTGGENLNELLEIVYNDILDIVFPYKYPFDGIQNIAGGYKYTLILKNDGTLWATGKNNYGQLGLDDETDRGVFVQVTRNISDVKKISAGTRQTFMLKNDGTVWACGYNMASSNNLGFDSTEDSNSTYYQTYFNQVPNLNDIIDIATGDDITVALQSDGTLWGIGDFFGYYAFTEQLTDVVKVACNYQHVIALKNDGTLWGIGDNYRGCLGLGLTAEEYETFTQITTNVSDINVSDIKEIACGYQSSYILKNDGTLLGTGNSDYGELGGDIGAYTPQFTQIASNVESMHIGPYTTVITTKDKLVKGTGANTDGQLGLGTFTNQKGFVTLDIDLDITAELMCGWNYVFQIRKDNTIYYAGFSSWSFNAYAAMPSL